MIRADVIELITDSPVAHGLFDDTVEETKRTVYCEVRSVTRQEYYLAFSAGLSPSFVFVLSNPAEYQDEKKLIYDGVRYKIVRAYCDGEKVELTAEREAVE